MTARMSNRPRGWIVPMPRKPREDGQAHVRAGMKMPNGARLEYDGAVPKHIAQAALLTIIRGERPAGQDDGIATAFNHAQVRAEGKDTQ